MADSPAAVAEGFAQAWEAADAEALAALFAPDADFVNVVGLRWRTRSEIRDAHAYGFRRMFPASTMTLQEVTVRELGSAAAVVHAAWTMTGQIAPDGKETSERSGVLSLTVVREDDGRWLAVSAQNTDRVPGAQTFTAEGQRMTPTTYARRRRRTGSRPREQDRP